MEEQALVPLTHHSEMGQSIDITVKKLQASGEYPLLFQKAFGTNEITPNGITKAIAQFERTLISANSRYDQYLAGTYQPSNLEIQGMNLFEGNSLMINRNRGGNCAHCHGGPKTYKELFHNNGLDISPTDIGREAFTLNKIDKGRFRVPTLRNILLTAPYMHDGRFDTIEEVLDHYSDHIQSSENLSNFIAYDKVNNQQLSLTKDEKIAIIAFLSMLTDSSFISNPAFSNPHEASH